jgi:DHA2 family multidrug resistance protein
MFFIVRELTTKNPAVDLRVLKHRSLAAGSLFSIVLGMALYGALFAVPIFAQNVLGYTALQTGLLLLPGSLMSGFAMPLAGALSKKFDARVLIIAGAIGLIISMFSLSKLSPITGVDNLFWPLLLRGGATVFMFLPLTLATIGPLPKKDISAASGIFNLTRQLGGSIGVAILTTILSNRTVYHRSIVGEHVGMWSVDTVSRIRAYTNLFVGKGYDITTAGQMAIASLDAAVRKQAQIISYGETFWIVSAILVLSLPLLFFLGSGRGVKVSADAH